MVLQLTRLHLATYWVLSSDWSMMARLWRQQLTWKPLFNLKWGGTYSHSVCCRGVWFVQICGENFACSGFLFLPGKHENVAVVGTDGVTMLLPCMCCCGRGKYSNMTPTLSCGVCRGAAFPSMWLDCYFVAQAWRIIATTSASLKENFVRDTQVISVHAHCCSKPSFTFWMIPVLNTKESGPWAAQVLGLTNQWQGVTSPALPDGVIASLFLLEQNWKSNLVLWLVYMHSPTSLCSQVELSPLHIWNRSQHSDNENIKICR